MSEVATSLRLPVVRRELKEVFAVDVRALHESMGAIVPLPLGRNGIQRYKVRTKLQHCNVVNRNRRRYWSDKTWGRHTRRDSPFMRVVQARRCTGQLEHPDSGRSHVKLGAIVVTDLEPPIESGEVFGTFETMSTPDGIIVARYIEDGVGFGLSSRGEGSVLLAADGVDDVQEDFTPKTFDVVSDESTPGAETSADLIASLHETARRTGALLLESAGGNMATAQLYALLETERALALDLGEALEPPAGANQFLLATPDQAGHYRGYQNGLGQWDVWFHPHNLAPLPVAKSMPTMKDAKAAAESHLRWHLGAGAEPADAGGTVPPTPLGTPGTAGSAPVAPATAITADAGKPVEIKVTVGEGAVVKKGRKIRAESVELEDVREYSGVAVYFSGFADEKECDKAADALADAGFMVHTDGEDVAVYTTIEQPEMAVEQVERVLQAAGIEMRDELEERVRLYRRGAAVFETATRRPSGVAEGELEFFDLGYAREAAVNLYDIALGGEETSEMDDPKMNPTAGMGAEPWEETLPAFEMDVAVGSPDEAPAGMGGEDPYAAYEGRLAALERMVGIGESSGYGTPPSVDDPEDLDLDLDREKAPQMDKANSTPVDAAVMEQVKKHISAAKQLIAGQRHEGIKPAYYTTAPRFNESKQALPGQIRCYFDAQDRLLEFREFDGAGNLIRRAGFLESKGKKGKGDDAKKDEKRKGKGDEKDKKDEKRTKRYESVSSAVKAIQEALAKGGSSAVVEGIAFPIVPATSVLGAAGTLTGASALSAAGPNEGGKKDDDEKKKDEKKAGKGDAEKDKKDEKKGKGDDSEKKDKKDESLLAEKDAKIRLLSGQVAQLETANKRLEGLLAEVKNAVRLQARDAALAEAVRARPELGAAKIQERLKLCATDEAVKSEVAALIGLVEGIRMPVLGAPPAPPIAGTITPMPAPTATAPQTHNGTSDATRAKVSTVTGHASPVGNLANLAESSTVGDTASLTAAYRRRQRTK